MFTRIWKAISVLMKPQAAEANARGQEAMQRGELDEAVEHFSTAIKCDPDNAVLIYNRGLAYLHAEKWELARADFDSAIKLTPDDAEATATIDRAWHRITGTTKGEPRDISIVRAKIEVPAVATEQLQSPAGDRVDYIALNEFTDVAADQFRVSLEKIVDAGGDKIILDLRDDPGGYLSTALAIASEFIADGVVYIEEDSRGEQKSTSAQGGGIATDASIQLVVLINEGSASASEILAGALQDRGRAILIGEPSFGKGVVQTFIDLSDGSGLKLTIAKWLTPNGRWIHETGLTPDIAVPAAPEGSEVDPVLEAALDAFK